MLKIDEKWWKVENRENDENLKIMIKNEKVVKVDDWVMIENFIDFLTYFYPQKTRSPGMGFYDKLPPKNDQKIWPKNDQKSSSGQS